MYTQEEMAEDLRVARYFSEDLECERLISVKRENPDIFARIPPAHQAKIGPYLERKRAHERLKAAGVVAGR